MNSPQHVTQSLWSPLKCQRKLRGWSQQNLVDELCKLCYEDGRIPGLNTKTVGRWEKGVNKPSPYYCKRLCQLFGMDAEELELL
jgi:transcriptional regulator with XRE-family HTH domain